MCVCVWAWTLIYFGHVLWYKLVLKWKIETNQKEIDLLVFFLFLISLYICAESGSERKQVIFKSFIHLFESESYTEKDRERER